MRNLTHQELREQISNLVYDDIFMRGIYNEDDFINAVIENLEVLSQDEKVDFDVNVARRIAIDVWNEEGEAIVERKIEEEIKRVEEVINRTDEEYKRMVGGRIW